MTETSISLVTASPVGQYEVRQQYWIEQVNTSVCGEDSKCNVFKGAFPNKETPVMGCTEKRACVTTSPLPERLEFFASGEHLARLEFVSRSGCCGEAIHRLLAPDVIGYRRISEIKSAQPLMGKELAFNVAPYFKSVKGYSSYFKIAYIVIIAFFVGMELLSYAFIGNLTIFLTMLFAALGGMLITVIAMLFWRFRPKCIFPHKNKILELVSIADEKKQFADIYLVSKGCCNLTYTYEINCYQEVDQNQLMALVSVALRSGYAIDKY